jgi:radical SAM superfamily enzyme YgiQ (UPF0313 family)
MSQPNNLRRCHTTLDQDSSLIAVVEMSQSSWLVAGIVPGISRQPATKLKPDQTPTKILLVFPLFNPNSFWSFGAACEAAGARCPAPPLGLITLAALLPQTWEFRLINRNAEPLDDADILWADLVMTGGMLPQQVDTLAIVRRCKDLGKPVCVGGPDPTSSPHLYDAADFLVLEHYLFVGIQFSRGCPFNCEFCDIIELYGRVPRTKTNEQMVAELDRLYTLGYRGHVDFVDDNLIGNKKALKRFLPALKAWQRTNRYPFKFSTEASINLADHPELLTPGQCSAGFLRDARPGGRYRGAGARPAESVFLVQNRRR